MTNNRLSIGLLAILVAVAITPTITQNSFAEVGVTTEVEFIGAIVDGATITVTWTDPDYGVDDINNITLTAASDVDCTTDTTVVAPTADDEEWDFTLTTGTRYFCIETEDNGIGLDSDTSDDTFNFEQPDVLPASALTATPVDITGMDLTWTLTSPNNYAGLSVLVATDDLFVNQVYEVVLNDGTATSLSFPITVDNSDVYAFDDDGDPIGTTTELTLEEGTTYYFAVDGVLDDSFFDDIDPTTSQSFDFGETVSATTGVTPKTGGGGSDNAHKTRPTFGLDWNTNAQIVEDGVTFNKVSYDVTDNFHTDFNRQHVLVGVNNVVAMKVYAPYDLKWVEFIFDVPETGAAHNAKASVFVPMTWMDTDEIDQDGVEVIQDVNLINVDKVEVYRTSVTCTADDVEENCDLIAAKVNFNEQPASGVFAFKAVDERNRSTTTYFNDGIEVTGDSLNPLETVLVSTPDRNHRGLVELTQVGDRWDNLWATEDGYTYEMNEFGTFLLVDSPETEVRVDSGSPDTRSHSAFNDLKTYESERAKYLYWNAEDNVSELAPSFAYEFPIEDSRTQFLKQHSMLEFVRGQ
jgi:hypothetical protein